MICFYHSPITVSTLRSLDGTVTNANGENLAVIRGIEGRNRGSGLLRPGG